MTSHCCTLHIDPSIRHVRPGIRTHEGVPTNVIGEIAGPFVGHSRVRRASGEGLAQKGGERVPLALVRWQCGAKKQAAEQRPTLEMEARQASWSNDLAGMKEV